MKKSQVLAAIALAFALGVVAPVAMVNNASAFTVEDVKNDITGSATEAEVTNAVAAVKEGYPMYSNIIALNTVLAAIDKGANSYDLQATSEKANLASAITTLLTDNGTLFEYTGDLDKTVWDAADGVYTAQISNAITEANKAKNFSIFADLYQAIEDENDANFRSAIKSFNNKYGASIAYNNTVTVKDSAASVKTEMGKVLGSADDLEAYLDLAAAVVEAREASTNYTTYLGQLGDALKANGVLTQSQLEGLLSTLKSDNPSIATIVKNYVTDANNVQTLITNWGAVEVAVANAEKNAISLAGATNYNLIMTIASKLETAVPVLEKTTEEIAQILAGYIPTETPTDPEGPNDTEEPGDADNKDDVTNPGNTGVISGTNGTASSTVAVVAGIATALTAAGAGVVAYRNARREA